MIAHLLIFLVYTVQTLHRGLVGTLVRAHSEPNDTSIFHRTYIASSILHPHYLPYILYVYMTYLFSFPKPLCAHDGPRKC